MAQAEALARLQEETKCPICLGDLTDPVTIKCGHNFCRTCIKDCWAELQGRFSCPVCRQQCQDGGLRSNAQLGRMIKAAQQLRSRNSKSKRQQSITRCETHKQALTLFCEDDLQLLCDQCLGSAGHNCHRVTPVAQAASHHRERLQGLIKLLKRQMKEVQELIRVQSERSLTLTEEAEAQRWELTFEFEQLNRFLDRERQAVLSRLEDQEKDIEQKLHENIAALENYSSTIKGLLSQAVPDGELPESELLSKVKDFYQNSKSQIISPSIIQVQLRREVCNFPLQYSALQKVIEQFTDYVTLDQETAHPNLLVSEDKKCVTFAKERQHTSDSSKRFIKSPVVLGFPYFNFGRHFWEVKVGDKAEWGIGICKGNLSIRARRSSTPKGCWRIVWKGDSFDVSGADLDSQQKNMTVRGIGVFLDYELGEVSFYSMPEKCHICTFRDTFTGAVCPYFYVGPHSEPLRLCSATGSK